MARVEKLSKKMHIYSFELYYYYYFYNLYNSFKNSSVTFRSQTLCALNVKLYCLPLLYCIIKDSFIYRLAFFLAFCPKIHPTVSSKLTSCVYQTFNYKSDLYIIFFPNWEFGTRLTCEKILRTSNAVWVTIVTKPFLLFKPTLNYVCPHT